MSGTVSDFMSRELIRVTPETSVQTVIQTLADHHISGLPVVNGQHHLVGVISELDLLWQESGVTPPPYITLLDSIIYLQNPSTYDRELHKALGQTAADVMTPKPITIQAQKPLLQKHRLGNAIPVFRQLFRQSVRRHPRPLVQRRPMTCQQQAGLLNRELIRALPRSSQ